MPRSRTDAELRTVLRTRSVRTETGCLEWAGVINRGGYGHISHRGATVLVHRLAYQLFRGPIPAGLHIDHLCSNRRCLEPTHLEPVTVRENNLRCGCWGGVNAPKTHCPAGHPYDRFNTYEHGGKRHCRACRRAASFRHYLKTKNSGAKK